ncbi:MAG: ATP-binding protein [Rhizomicrobium sp.]|nr:ATP-binding protein [Rhizomicrobium sp.]
MQLRTFLAKDMRQALTDVRNSMGPEAVIVASQPAKGGGVMVRAALEEPEPPLDLIDPVAGDEEDVDALFHDSMIRRLREKKSNLPGRRPFDRMEMLAAFAKNRLPETLAHILAESAAKAGLSDMTLALAAAIDQRMTIAPIDFANAQAILLVGPNGAGKTAIAAKIGAHARLAGRHVRLVAHDVTGAGAVARLKDFADHLDAQIVTAESAYALAAVVAEAVRDGALAIIDTAGFDPRQAKAAAAFAALAQIQAVEIIGVVSALTDSEEVSEIAEALSKLGASRIVITAADMSRRMGALAAAALTPELPLGFVTRSPFVAGDLETLTPLALARLLIEQAEGTQ